MHGGNTVKFSMSYSQNGHIIFFQMTVHIFFLRVEFLIIPACEQVTYSRNLTLNMFVTILDLCSLPLS